VESGNERKELELRGLGRMDNLEWNCWNLVLIRLYMKGIFRSVWFDTNKPRSVKDGWIEGLCTRVKFSCLSVTLQRVPYYLRKKK
jgi:hypothetical protein